MCSCLATPLWSECQVSSRVYGAGMRLHETRQIQCHRMQIAHGMCPGLLRVQDAS